VLRCAPALRRIDPNQRLFRKAVAARYAACASCMDGTHNRTHDSIHYGTGSIQAVAADNVKEIPLGNFPHFAFFNVNLSLSRTFVARPPNNSPARNCRIVCRRTFPSGDLWSANRERLAAILCFDGVEEPARAAAAQNEKSARPAKCCRARGLNHIMVSPEN
jgi:hypothetical protein